MALRTGIFAFIFLMAFSSLDAGTMPMAQKEALLNSVSDALFIKARLEQSIAEEKIALLNYDLKTKLIVKTATTEMEVRQALWQYKRTQAIHRFLQSTLDTKQQEININKIVAPSPEEVETFYHALWNGRVEAAKAELARAEEDRSYFAYAYGVQKKLHEKAATTKQEVLTAKYHLEGAAEEVAGISKRLAELESIISDKR